MTHTGRPTTSPIQLTPSISYEFLVRVGGGNRQNVLQNCIPFIDIQHIGRPHSQPPLALDWEVEWGHNFLKIHIPLIRAPQNTFLGLSRNLNKKK